MENVYYVAILAIADARWKGIRQSCRRRFMRLHSSRPRDRRPEG
jgi:hypothetical protein